MLYALFRRPRAADATRTFYLLNVLSTFCFALTFTVSVVYYVNTLGLDPLRLVLVGTVLEVTCFLLEVPTGLVADLHSRRLSVVIGFALIGTGLFLQAAIATYAAVIIAQVLWGAGATFTSGATEAWITDEIGPDAVGPVFTRAQQLTLLASIGGTVVAGALSLLDVRLSMLLSGLGFLGLTVGLAVLMPERHFVRPPRTDRSGVGTMIDTARAGLALARRRPVVRTVLVVSLLVGLSAEAFDRLWEYHVLRDFGLPPLFGADRPAVWFAGFSLVGIALALVSSLVANRFAAGHLQHSHPNRVLAVLAGIQVVGTLALALTGWLAVALAALWLRGAAAAVAQPVLAAWLNRHIDPALRATVLSVDSQANAIGQVAGGPPLGLLGRTWSVPAALVASGLLLAPTVAILARLTPARVPDPAPPLPAERTGALMSGVR